MKISAAPAHPGHVSPNHWTTADGLAEAEATVHGVAVDPHDDHRTAMAFAVLGLAVGGMAIRDPECVEKSFPGFWEALYKEGLL